MMDLQRFAEMDAGMLYSLLNMKLRNDHSDLDDLVRCHDISRAGLQRHLAASGFVYLPAVRQFRASD